MINIKRIHLITLLFSVFFITTITAQKINQLDANGKRTGVWEKYYKNDKLRYKGQFKNGKEVGVFEFYSMTSSSQPVIVKAFIENSNTALVKFFTEKGKLKSKGKMNGKKREGKWIYYFTNGKVFSEENYANGELDGVLKNYYPNGKVTEETSYKSGKKHGVSKTFTDTGILIEEINYANGKSNGLAKYYDLKGNLKEKGVYNNGKREGKWLFYMDGEEVDNLEERKKARSLKRFKSDN